MMLVTKVGLPPLCNSRAHTNLFGKNSVLSVVIEPGMGEYLCCRQLAAATKSGLTSAEGFNKIQAAARMCFAGFILLGLV
jgi:hypothetical protein